MKTIRIAIFAVALAGFSITSFADTYSWVNKDGQKIFSDRPPVGTPYVIKANAPSAPYSPAVVPQYGTQSNTAANGGNPRINETYTADSASAVKERNRGQSRECIGLQQNISRLSSSRNFTVDPETGGSIEERRIQDAKNLYDATCGA
jgi:hypothetical protein